MGASRLFGAYSYIMGGPPRKESYHMLVLLEHGPHAKQWSQQATQQKNQDVDSQLRGMMVQTASPCWRSEGASRGGRAATVVWSFFRILQGDARKTKAGGRPGVGAGTLCSSVFDESIFILQKMFAGRGPKMWWAKRI